MRKSEHWQLFYEEHCPPHPLLDCLSTPGQPNYPEIVQLYNRLEKSERPIASVFYDVATGEQNRSTLRKLRIDLDKLMESDNCQAILDTYQQKVAKTPELALFHDDNIRLGAHLYSLFTTERFINKVRKYFPNLKEKPKRDDWLLDDPGCYYPYLTFSGYPNNNSYDDYQLGNDEGLKRLNNICFNYLFYPNCEYMKHTFNDSLKKGEQSRSIYNLTPTPFLLARMWALHKFNLYIDTLKPQSPRTFKTVERKLAKLFCHTNLVLRDLPETNFQTVYEEIWDFCQQPNTIEDNSQTEQNNLRQGQHQQLLANQRSMDQIFDSLYLYANAKFYHTP